MELLDYAEEQCLIRKIEKIHDEIFSRPAKRYVFLLEKLIGISGGTIFPGYLFMSERSDKEIVCTGSLEERKFGDITVNLIFEKHENAKNNVELIKKDNRYEIVVVCHFLCFRQVIQLYREAIEAYEFKKHKNIEVTQLISLECTLRRLNNE